MDILMVTGGRLDIDFLREICSCDKYNYIIGVDQGNDSLEKLMIEPDMAVGDFDSIDKGLSERYRRLKSWIVLNPVKDYTDTRIAMAKAIELKPESITIVGATGGRLDHLLGNLDILIHAVRAGVPAYILDECNRIRLIDKSCVIKRSEQYGRYVSLLPYTERVNGISLRGFAYNLEAASIIKGETIGISNEIREEEGFVSIEEGYLMVMETKD